MWNYVFVGLIKKWLKLINKQYLSNPDNIMVLMITTFEDVISCKNDFGDNNKQVLKLVQAIKDAQDSWSSCSSE